MRAFPGVDTGAPGIICDWCIYGIHVVYGFFSHLRATPVVVGYQVTVPSGTVPSAHPRWARKLRARLESTLVYQLERFSLNVLILYLEYLVSQILSYFIFLHFIYFATMVACYSIPGFNPKEITQSFKFIRTLSRFI